ncbi:uncharacterized protein TNCV_4593571 [Trichonephila clavipes]|uniref:Uncharacterized protein n=1 Tax=Trichonephila clavipes TaxID=2585209 RepID=A0A8X7BJL5_TRICX|nr:uncharacterized protein TNCV_4593571 [Trichonephila clavipes]
MEHALSSEKYLDTQWDGLQVENKPTGRPDQKVSHSEQWFQNDTEQHIVPDTEFIAAVTVHEKIPENDEEFNIEDIQTPNISYSFWQPILCEVNDTQHYLQTEGLNIHQCAQKIRALQTVLETKREEIVDDALIYPKILCEELEISFEHQDESGGSIYLATEKDSNSCRTGARPEVILNMDELNLDQASKDINKEEFQIERVRLQASVAPTDPGCKKELIGSGFLGLLKYIIESKL